MTRPIWAARVLKHEIYIKNGSFENNPPFTAATTAAGLWINGQSGGDVRDNRYGWWLQANGGNARFDRSDKYVGGASLCLFCLGSGAAVDLAATNYPGGANVRGYCPALKPGTTYVATFRLKTTWLDGTPSTVGNGATFQAIVRNAAGSLVSGVTGVQTLSQSESVANQYLTSTTDWTLYTLTFTTPADPTGAGLFYAPKLIIFNSLGNKDTVMKAWYDDLRLYEEAV